MFIEHMQSVYGVEITTLETNNADGLKVGVLGTLEAVHAFMEDNTTVGNVDAHMRRHQLHPMTMPSANYTPRRSA